MQYFYMYSDCLGCAVLLCLVVCLTLLACLFFPSHLSLKHVSVVTGALVVSSFIPVYIIHVYILYHWTCTVSVQL